MKTVFALAALISMNVATSAEIPLPYSITIENPTHMGVPFLAYTGLENVRGEQSNQVLRASKICEALGYKELVGSAIELSGTDGTILMTIDNDGHASSKDYSRFYSRYYRSHYRFAIFTKISCRKD